MGLLVKSIAMNKLCKTTSILAVSTPIGFPGGSVVKNPPGNAENACLIPGLGRSPGEGHNNPLQYSCLGNIMDRGAWKAIVQGVEKGVRHNLAT